MTNIYDERYAERTAAVLKQGGLTVDDLARHMKMPKERIREALEAYSFATRAEANKRLGELEDIVHKDESFEELLARRMDFCRITPEGLARLMRVSPKLLYALLEPPFETRKAINAALEEILGRQEKAKSAPRKRIWRLSNGAQPMATKYRTKGLRGRSY